MRRAFRRSVAAALLAVALAAAPVRAEEGAPALFALAQLDALLAPVALYPDAVLAPLLMAVGDPLELMEAARWQARPEHAALAGADLLAALAHEDWGPHVKALTPFPGLLQMLDANLRWTLQLGYAVSDQPQEVLDSVRRLRRQALATGALDSRPGAADVAISVRHNGAAVVLAPVDPGRIALPTVDPAAAYGTWPYPSVAPVRLDKLSTAPVAVPRPLRDLAGIDWARLEVMVNVAGWNAVNAGRPPVTQSGWRPRPVYAVTGRINVSLGAPPVPPDGPVGRPAPPSGIPANAIGRIIVSVPATLVRPPVGGAALAAAPPSQTTPAPSLPLVATAAPSPDATAAPPPPSPLQLAPLPAHVETVRASALADIATGADVALFARRGDESLGHPVGPARSAKAAGATP